MRGKSKGTGIIRAVMVICFIAVLLDTVMRYEKRDGRDPALPYSRHELEHKGTFSGLRVATLTGGVERGAWRAISAVKAAPLSQRCLTSSSVRVASCC